MKQIALCVVGALFALAAPHLSVAADQPMPAPPPASGKMMEDQKDQGMAMKMKEKTMGGMKTDGMKTDGMTTGEKMGGMGMTTKENDNMNMEKK